jgi:hypothetical protein
MIKNSFFSVYGVMRNAEGGRKDEQVKVGARGDEKL